MSRMVELLLDIEQAVSGQHRVKATLRERAFYPPRFQVVQGRVREVGDWSLGGKDERHRQAQGRIPEGYLSLTFPLLLRESKRSFLRRFETDLAAPLFEVLLGDVLQVANRFFQEARHEYSSQYRLTVRSELAEVLGFPWPSLLSLLSRTGAETFDHRVAIIARHPGQLVPRSILRLPLTVLVNRRGGPLTLDTITQEAIRLGVFAVQYTGFFEKNGEGTHIIVDERVTPDSAREPRLVVIEAQSDESDLPAQLEKGVDAALLVVGKEKARRRFFQHFYGEILRNQPLEQCVHRALAACSRLTVRVAFGAREGGEHSLLFTRAAAEIRDWAMGPLPIGGPDPSPDPEQTLEAIESRLAQDIPVLEPSRVRRHFRAFQQSLNTSIRNTTTRLDERLSSLEGLAFGDDDSRVLSELAQSLEALRSDAEKVQDERLLRMSTGNLNSLLEQSDDRELQRSFTRLLNVWLSHGHGKRPVDRTHPLERGAHAWLHLKISPVQVAKAFSAIFPNFQVELSLGREPVLLEVCIFHDEEAVLVEKPRGELLLPPRGESTEFRTYLRPKASGLCRLRVCLFYRGTLLQSVVVEAEVVEDSANTSSLTEGPEPIRYTLDYVANSDFLLLDQHTPPVLSLVTNHAAGGAVWLGVFSRQESGHDGLRTGCLHTFPEERLSTFVQKVRKELFALQKKEGGGYQNALDASNRAVRAKGFVQLASQGARLYHALFSGNLSLPKEKLQTFHDGLWQPGLISIARCDLTEASIPWAMLYDLPLDTGDAARLKLCPVFLKQLEAQQDRLDAPESCRSLPECPLRGDQARQTVCPFGFWGVRHQLEQPLKQLRVEDPKKPPPELNQPGFAENCQLIAYPAPPQAFMGCGSKADGAEVHYQELRQLPGWELARSTIRQEVIEAFEREPHLLYLYCHGLQKDGVFKLKFEDAFIEATSLELNWERRPFFVFLNACDSVATLPETLNTFLSTLIRLGALAVIGSEIKINTLFARQFARRVLEDFLAGKPLGAAFLSARRHFLRQLNPLALAYTLHAAADVHLHGAKCTHCESRIGANGAGAP